MLIKLDEHYRKFTNGFAEHEVEGKTVKDVFYVLCNRYPQLLVHLQDNDSDVCLRSGVMLNGEFLVSKDSADITLTEHDIITLTLEIPAGNDSVINIIAGAVLIIIGAVLALTGYGTLFGSFMIKVGIGLIIGGVAGLVMEAFFTPESPSQDAPSLLDNSYTYTFNGIRNTTASGTPVQVIYGEHRVGGQVLNMYLTTEGGFEPAYGGIDTITTCNYLNAQIGLCEGEIQSVGDIHINQLPQAFYNEVTCDYRLGEASQTLLPNFSFVQNTTSINRKVLYGGGGQASVSFSNYTPVYGVLSGGWNTPTLQLGMYTSAVTWTEAG